MRIIAGQFRGRTLTPVGKGDPRAHLRPTTDRVREALFNMLAGGRFGDPFEGSRVLDLFAGTGALGLEALSRGAAQVIFVDDGRAAQRLLRDNIRLLGVEGQTRIVARDARKLPATTEPCQLIFLDPPYAREMGVAALHAAKTGGWIAPGALVVWEEAKPQSAPDGFEALEVRRYGDTHVTVLRAA